VDLFKKVFTKRFGRNEFAALVSKALAESGTSTVGYDEENFSLHCADGSTVFLENGHASFCAAEKRDRQSVLKKFVAGSVVRESIPSDFEVARPHLVPVVRSASYFGFTYLQSQASGKNDLGLKVATHVLAGDLVTGLAYDTEHTMSFVNQVSLGKWHIGFTEAMNVARDNLRGRTDPNRMVQHAPGLFVGQWDDSYETSRMLLTDMIYRLPLYGDPVVSVPSRNQLWVTGSRNAGGIDSMIRFCQEDHFGAYPLSPYLFLLRDGQWTKFMPEAETLQGSLNAIERRRLALDYGQQKKYLEVIYEREKIDVFVASYTVFTVNATGREYSASVWSNGVDSLLPATDETILLVDPKTKDRVSVTWPIMQSVVGDMMEKRADLIPERYRVRSFPSPEKIAELRRRTVV
jgi:hypothetical protein